MNFENKNEIIKAILYRLLPTLLVFILALLAFNHGVYLEGKPNICTDTIFVQIYYTIGLFLLAGIDFGMPMGGTEFYRILLYIAYFLAPLLTVVAVIEAVVRSINPSFFIKKSFKDHIVIVGAGKLAISELNKKKGIPAIIVERDKNNKNLDTIKSIHKNIKILTGEMTDPAIKEKSFIQHAKYFWAFTNKDVININLALKIKGQYKDINVIIRVEDFETHDIMKSEEIKDQRIEIYSVHEKLAEKFVDQDESFKSLKTLVIYGFGRFGHYVLEAILKENKFLENLIIIDPEATKKWKNYIHRKKLQDSNFKQIGDVSPWDTVSGEYSTLATIKDEFRSDQNIHFVMCANLPNYENIITAINVADSFEECKIFLRSSSSASEEKVSSSTFEEKVIAEDKYKKINIFYEKKELNCS